MLLPAGLAGDRWGRKKLLLSGVGLFGAAIIMPMSMSFLPIIFPPEERSKAISIWSVGMALGFPLGPILGGWLLENYWWGSVLLINIPVVLVAFVAAAILLPESKDPSAPKLDLAVSGFTALQTGIRLIPLILGLAVSGRLAPRICAKLGYPTTIAAGMLVLAAGFGLGTVIGNTTVWLTIIGLGLGCVMVPAMDAVLATLPEHKSGTGSGLVQTLRQVAGAFAVAGLGSLLSSVYRANLPADAPEPARESIVAAAALPDPVLFEQAKHAFLAGMDAVLLVSAGGALLGAVLVALLLPRSGKPEVVRESEDDLARVA